MSDIDAVGSIGFACDVLTLGAVTITLSTGGSGSYATRTLASGANHLNYNLYFDASRTQIWGNGTSGTVQYGPTHPILGTVQTLTVYGRLPARQNVPTGSYSDTITTTLLF